MTDPKKQPAMEQEDFDPEPGGADKDPYDGRDVKQDDVEKDN